MSGYQFDPKNNCVRQEAACTYYEEYIPSDSPLISNECSTIAETTEDLYKITDTLKTNADLSTLGQDCINYNEVLAGQPTVLEFARVIEKEVCELKTFNSNQVEGICNLPIADCNIDLKTLVDSCNIIPTTFSDLLQVLVDEIQVLKSKVETLETFHP